MRINQSDLDNKVERLNRIKFDTPPEYSTIGAYCLDYAYGGVQLHQYMNESGGVTDIFRQGYMTKRELYNLICAYEGGMEANQS
jgi:hypothetical protein